MLLGHWHPVTSGSEDVRTTHLHGRDLEVRHSAATAGWRWRVTSPHGAVLAEGDAASRDDAEVAAEAETLAVHPPTGELVERLLG